MPEEIDFHKPGTAAEPERSAPKSQTATPAASAKQPGKFPAGLIVSALVLTLLLAAGVYFFGPKKPDAARHGKPKNVPVTVAAAKLEEVPIEIRTTGNILAYSTVNIVPQVSGQLTKVCFTQGQTVKKGDLLFLIDPRPYQASLDQALGNMEKDQANIKSAQANMARDQAAVGQLQANLAKDEASLRYADVEAQRYKRLVQQGAISMEQADQTVTNDATALAQIDGDKKQIENEQAVVSSDKAQIDTARATLVADQAVVENARIQLGWCTIRAPLEGRTGSLQIYQGNVVAANSPTAIVTIAQVQPIYVQFTIPEEYLDQVRRCLLNGSLRIQALIEGVAADAVSGTATFMDNTVNTTSGTALLRASFANADVRLFPGQFVDVKVTMPPPGPSVVVPIAAIQTTQKGNAVYVVGADRTVKLLPVDLARSSDNWAAVDSGLKAGDTVVTDGQLQLTPGMSVKVVTADGTSQGGSGNQHKHGAGSSPDAGFNPASIGSDSTQPDADSSSLSTGGTAGGSGSGWGTSQTPGWGQAKAPQAPAALQGSAAGNALPQPGSALFNPATSGGTPFRAAPVMPPSGGSGSGFSALPGAHGSGGGGWRHRH